MGINQQNSVYVIAEIGINHNGDINAARNMIDLAKASGADAAKFQSFHTELLIREDQEKMPYQVRAEEDNSQFAMLKKVELSKEDHFALFDYCEKAGIEFISTPYDDDSAKFLAELGVKKIKVASTDSTNLPFLRYLMSLEKEIILSSGVTSGEELDLVMADLQQQAKQSPISVLHCVSNYPAPLAEINLRVLQNLAKKYACPIGFSDHTNDLEVGAFAVMAGAQIIEKHFTLDKEASGPDHRASLDPEELKMYIHNIRKAESCLGDGIKRVMPSEAKIKQHMQKSIVAKNELKAGTIIGAEHIWTMRPATGITPLEVDKLLGKTLTKDYQKFDSFQWGDLK